jgi:hypothetical protein
MVERLRQQEGGLDLQLRYGSKADQKLKVALTQHPELRTAFYSCFRGVKSPDHDVDTLHVFMLDYIWKADTSRRLEDAKEFFECYKSKSQTTTRTAVGTKAKKVRK